MANSKPNQFEVLAECYDILNGADYEKYAEFVQKMLEKHGTGGKLLLDLACGTGSLAVKLAKNGFDMTGIDCSPEMLSLAQQKAAEAEQNILFLLQDMQNFELYGTVDGIICTLDGINYLTKPEDLTSCFKKIHNYLNYGGIFIFDVNTPHKFETILSNRDYFLHEKTAENVDFYLGWKSNFDKKSELCSFDLTVFSGDGCGNYKKTEEKQLERSWDMPTLSRAITESGIEILEVFSDLELSDAKNDSEKWFFVCKKPPKK